MCGIVGILVRNGGVPADVLERANLSLSHRGPDDSGTVIIRSTEPFLEIGLANRRLAIQDLSALGHQPMHDPETGNWMVYNGEIYNFREIRQRLERQGHRFASRSDTEVLLKAYGCWGERCLIELRGMFAFALWDAQRRRLFLARDPMGIKPLYYYSSDKYLLFASEVRTLLSTGLVPRRLDSVGLINYLRFGSAYDPATLIEGIFALRPGYYLVWQDGVLREQRYWDLVDGSVEQNCRKEVNSSPTVRKSLEQDLQHQLRDASRMQLVSDVPVGVFLSGGIDSSSLVAILSSGGTKLSTFSLTFPEASFSEAEYSQNIARRFGTDHHEICISPQDALEAIPDALDAMDQPTSDGLNTFLVSRQTRAAGLKVALSGLGGDEIFAGYSSFRTVPRMEHFDKFWNHVPDVARRTAGDVFSWLAPGNDRNRKLSALARGNGYVPHPYFLSRMLFTPEWHDRLLSSASEQVLQQANAPLREALSRSESLDAINRVSYLEARCYMLNTLLRDSDSMSMSQGLELRVPLLDHVVAKAVLSLPGAWKRRNGLPKPLLVKALSDPLPEEVVRRPKRGFTLPFEHWLKDGMRAEVESTLRRIPEGALGAFLKVQGVRDVWRNFLDGTMSWSRPWSLYVLQRWCELHL